MVEGIQVIGSWSMQRSWQGLASAAVFAASLLLAPLIGLTIVQGKIEVAFVLSCGLLSMLLFNRLSFVGWASFLLIASVATRGLVEIAGLPAAADFLHYPIAIGFALRAATLPRRAAATGPLRWMIGFLLVTLASAIAHPDNPMRTLLFLLIAGEPLLIIWATARWGPDERDLRDVGRVAIFLALIQLPIALFQVVTMGIGDFVQGTLTGHGAGHHVLGALFALCLFIGISGRLTHHFTFARSLVIAVVSVAMMLATSSMAITIIAGIAVAFSSFGKTLGSRARASGRLRQVMVVTAISATSLVLAASFIPNIYERMFELVKLDELPPVVMIQERTEGDGKTMLLGTGPSTSASRSGLLLVVPKEGGPLQALGVPPTDAAYAFYYSTPEFGGSAEREVSGVLGIVGDLGLIGLIGFLILMFLMWRRTTSSTSWLAPAARAAILAAAALVWVDNWLEYPEFAVAWALLVGAAIARSDGDVPSER